jgi:Domain of unknown function (DUF4424)
MRFMVLFVAAVLASSPALANDGYSQIGIGGLVLTGTDEISMDSEDLYVSEQEIRVNYVMTNTTNKDVEATVMFPLPDVMLSEEYESARGLVDLAKDLKFKTTVEGQPFPIKLVQRGFVGTVDVTDALTKSGIPVSGVMDVDLQSFVQKMPADQRQVLIDLGALPKSTDDNGNVLPYDPDLSIAPAWVLRSYVMRKQVFPAGRSLKVSHRYAPIEGSAVESSVNYTADYMAQLEGEGLQYFKDEQAKYCVDADWIKAYRARVKKQGGKLGTPTWISYILKSGATWKGPIKDFRMVVDKGRADALVSFCAEGVRKISPTQFEVRKKNFEPTRDLDVLMMRW